MQRYCQEVRKVNWSQLSLELKLLVAGLLLDLCLETDSFREILARDSKDIEEVRKELREADAELKAKRALIDEEMVKKTTDKQVHKAASNCSFFSCLLQVFFC